MLFRLLFRWTNSEGASLYLPKIENRESKAWSTRTLPCVKGRTVGPNPSELARINAGCYSPIIWLRVSVEVRGDHCGGSDCPGPFRRYLNNTGLRESEARAFVRSEKERLVLPDWTTQKGTKIVVTFCCAWLTRLICEPVVRIQNAIAEVLEQSTVEIIRPRTCGQDDLPTRRAAEFWRKRGSSTRNSCRASTETKLLVPPIALRACAEPVPDAPVPVFAMTPKFAETPSTLKLFASVL